MKYIGRVVGAGITKEGNPFAVYGASGRSETSKRRKFVLDSSGYVGVRPLSFNISEEQAEKSQFLTYNPMRIKNNTLFVANGVHNDTSQIGEIYKLNFERDFVDFAKSPELARGAAEEIMENNGYERDEFSTPRLSIVRNPKVALFSIVVNNDGKDKADSISVELSPGKTLGLSTYHGDGLEVVSWAGDIDIRGCLFEIPITKESPSEIAQEFYEFFDSNLVISTASAVFKEKKWNIAVKNSYETEEEFQNYLKMRRS